MNRTKYRTIRPDSPRRWDVIHLEPNPKLTQVVKVAIVYEAMQPGNYGYALQLQPGNIKLIGTFTVYK